MKPSEDFDGNVSGAKAIADQLYLANLLKIVELWPANSEFAQRARELVEGELG